VEAISYGAFSGILYGIVVYVWQPYWSPTTYGLNC